MNKINPIRKEIVKQSLLQGKTQRQALKDAGLSKATAEHRVRADNTLLNVAKAELLDGFNKAEITPELVLSGLLKEYSEATKSSDRQNALMLLGKYLCMFADKTINKTDLTLTQEESNIIDKYIHSNRLSKQ